MTMVKCDFCNREIPEHKGLTFVRTDCSVLHLCSRKCRINFKMKRNPVKIKWTGKHKKKNK